MTEHPVIQLLEDLSINLVSREHEHYKFHNSPYMALTIETMRDSYDGELVVMMTHYGEQNGDLMADPDIVFRLVHVKDVDLQKFHGRFIVQPMSYRNDYLGIMQTIREVRTEKVNGTEVSQVWVNRKGHEDVSRFLKQWTKNLREQGFTKEKRVIVQ